MCNTCLSHCLYAFLVYLILCSWHIYFFGVIYHIAYVPKGSIYFNIKKKIIVCQTMENIIHKHIYIYIYINFTRKSFLTTAIVLCDTVYACTTILARWRPTFIPICLTLYARISIYAITRICTVDFVMQFMNLLLLAPKICWTLKSIQNVNK